MKFFRLDLLTLLISLFTFYGCKNQGAIGLGVNAGSQLSGNLIDTSTIIINTIPEDSLITSNTGGNSMAKTPLGIFNDPVFGTTESDVAMDLTLPGAATSYTVPTGTISIDSAILAIRYAPGFYGDSIASRYKVNVYQLNERLYTNSIYYNTKQWNYNSATLVGTKTFFSRTHDSIYLHAFVTGGKDSMSKEPPQLRVPINPVFASQVLFNAPPAELASGLVYKNNVHGLFLKMDPSGSTGAGGMFMMAMDSSASLNIYYRVANGTTIDTNTVALSSSLHAAQIKHTYSSAVQTELNNTTTGSRNNFYIQGTAGLRAKISFPYIKNILKTIGTNIVINRAELIVTPSPGSNIPFPPLQKIALYQYDIAHQRAELQDATSSDPRSQGDAVFGGYYSSSLMNYHYIITAYIQDLMRGITLDYGTYLGAVDGDAVSSATYVQPTAQTAARTFAVGTNPLSPFKIVLNIIYTKYPK